MADQTLEQQTQILADAVPETAELMVKLTGLGQGVNGTRKISPNELRKLVKLQDEVVTRSFTAGNYTLTNTDLGKIIYFDMGDVDADVTLSIPDGLNNGIIRVLRMGDENFDCGVQKASGSSVVVYHRSNAPTSRSSLYTIFLYGGNAYVTYKPISSLAYTTELESNWDDLDNDLLDASKLDPASLVEQIDSGLLGGASKLWPHDLDNTVPPTATDDASKGFVVGSLWYSKSGVDLTTGLYRCTSNTTGAATWEKIVTKAASYEKATDAQIEAEDEDVLLTPGGGLYLLQYFLANVWNSSQTPDGSFDPYKLQQGQTHDFINDLANGEWDPKHNWTATVDPAATDDVTSGYGRHSFWYNSAAGKLFTCVLEQQNAANWVQIAPSTGGGTATTLAALTDTDVVGPFNNETLRWNGSFWENIYLGNLINTLPENGLDAQFLDPGSIRDQLDKVLLIGWDYGIASQAEAEAGTSAVKNMTPQRTKEAIIALLQTAWQAQTAGNLGATPIDPEDIRGGLYTISRGDFDPTHKWNATVPPTATDDDAEGYTKHSFWYDTSTQKVYTCVDNTEGAAVWVDLTAAGSGSILGEVPESNESAARDLNDNDWGSIIRFDMSSGAYSLTVPSGLTAERSVSIELSDASNNLTIAAGGGVTINGDNVLTAANKVITLYHTSVQDTYRIYANASGEEIEAALDAHIGVGWKATGGGGSGFSDFIDVTTIGVVGNGTTDDSANIASALASYDKLYFPKATYKINSGFSIPSGKRIFASDATWVADTAQTIDIKGTNGTASNFYASSNEGDFQVKAATKGVFSAGDDIVLQDTADSTRKQNHERGQFMQLVKVLSVDTSNGNYDALTIDQPDACGYTLGSTTKARIVKVTPVEDVEVDLGTLGTNVSMDIRRARRCRIRARSNANKEMIIAEGTGQHDSKANDEMIVDFRADYTVGPSGTQNEAIRFEGWNNTRGEIWCRGGKESALVFRNGSNYDLRATIIAPGIRSVWAYAATGVIQAITYNPFQVFVGNAEHFQCEWCHNLHWKDCAVYGWDDGDGWECSGANYNITVSNYRCFEGEGPSNTTQNALNIHGNCKNMRFIGGHIVGGDTQSAIHIRESVDGCLIQGYKVEPYPGDTAFAPVFIGENMSSSGSQKNITIRDCHFVGNGQTAIVAKDQTGNGYRIENLVLDNVTIEHESVALANAIILWDTDYAVVKGVRYVNGSAKFDFGGYGSNNPSTNLYVEQDTCYGVSSFDKAGATFRSAGPLT